MNLVFTSFSTLINRAFIGPPWPNYNDGGFDALFIGFGGGTPLPDFGTNNVLNYRTDDFAPNGNNYMGFSNSTYDNLANQYAASFSVSQRTTLALQMNAIIAEQRPTLVIEYPALVTGFASNIYPWNQQKTYTESVTGTDIQHFKVLGSNGQPSTNAVLNIAETGDINSVNPLPTSTSNSIYDRYLYGMVSAGLGSSTRPTHSTSTGLATSITSTADHLTWTVSFAPHTFWDGVAVTSDDYLFSMMAQLDGLHGRGRPWHVPDPSGPEHQVHPAQRDHQVHRQRDVRPHSTGRLRSNLDVHLDQRDHLHLHDASSVRVHRPDTNRNRRASDAPLREGTLQPVGYRLLQHTPEQADNRHLEHDQVRRERQLCLRLWSDR